MKIRKHITTILLLIFSFSAFAQIQVGDILPSIELKNNFNEPINSNQFKDKYVLVDFWASWCGPCRLGNKKLVKLHKVLDPSKIEIIGISIDTDQSKWIKAIEKDKLSFLQLIDPNGFDAKTAVLFGAEELPSKYLFNDKGVLILKNPTDEQIINLIK
ncbi:TlpA disulfide reductase family protein [Flavobacterium sp.]|uniref:TlpA family protein disulfide reductase n=1 Tax=Flavobacterium sp. TaxID=239 RepID=UPI0024871732|nr:TlpA disulfide reductase family protein [Flavobacterium sp.]MDI1317031.1 TlpA disulfide reductase family protein [Flavobacterium sp.]